MNAVEDFEEADQGQLQQHPSNLLTRTKNKAETLGLSPSAFRDAKAYMLASLSEAPGYSIRKTHDPKVVAVDLLEQNEEGQRVLESQQHRSNFASPTIKSKPSQQENGWAAASGADAVDERLMLVAKVFWFILSFSA